MGWGRWLKGLVAGLCGVLAAPSAQAEWLEATSRHFVLYADSNPASLKKQAEALERLDWALRRFMSAEDEPDIHSRKVTVFLVDDADIARLCRCRNVGGFYMSRVSGSLAFSGKGGWTDSNNQGRLVLFHEYTHHFLLGTYSSAFPAWFQEGFAEFAATMRIAEDGATIGYPAQHRAYSLVAGERLTSAQMFDPTAKDRWSPERMDAFYGRGWLMTHYFSFDRTRFAQLRKYLNAINHGTPGVEAARQEFGDLKALDRDLSAYLHRNRLPGLTLRFGDAKVPAVTIRSLTAGESAMIGSRMESVRGVDRETGIKLYRKAAPIAARYPDDPVVQGWLAEMAYDADEDAASEAAAARAIARDPKSVQALLYRGRVQLRALKAAKSTDAAAWDAARRLVIAANRVDPDDAEPLWIFWQSFAMQGRDPAPSAFKGLYRAQELAPQDNGVRFAAATARLKAGELQEALQLLRPMAYSPHAKPGNPASAMIAAIDAGKKGADVIAAGASAALATTDDEDTDQ